MQAISAAAPTKTSASGDLSPAELVDVRLKTSEALARQSIPGLYAHGLLAAVILGTSSPARAHVGWLAAAAAWVVVVGGFRFVVAKSLARMNGGGPLKWARLFRLGTVASSATWGVGGALLLAAADFDRESGLVLLTLAGISAGGIASLSGDKALLRMHLALVLGPTLVCGLLFLQGPLRFVAGFITVVASFAAFLWVQASHANASFLNGLVTAKLLERHAEELERHAKELDQARLESIEASRAKSEFLANMSHEIRTPMSAVIGYADLLLDPVLGASERVNHVQTIRRNGEHLLSLVDDILDISKIEAGKMTVESIATSPSQIVVEVASLMRVRAVEKNLTFDIRFEGKIPETIQSDPTRLKQIVMNFVTNGIKFTRRGGITILVRCDGAESLAPTLVIEVADTGVGMTEQQLARVFAPFVQADTSTTRQFGGSGLGLVISRRLAELLGGSVAAQSKPGGGSAFCATVPTGSLAGVTMLEGLAEAGVVDPSPDAVRRAPSLPPSCRVLLAEDGYDNQVLIKTFLVKAGATVTIVADGRLAVEEAMGAAAKGKPYDVVLMDMQMPVLDGYSATSKLRLLGYTRPIVALTAHAMVGDRERCEGAGCDDYLTKPVNRVQLTATVARFAKSAASATPLVSTLVGDEDMTEIVHQFVRDLPERSSAILRACQASDVETLTRLTHQLSGSAGGYGFPRITDAARVVEQALVEGLGPAILQERVDMLATLCRRARAA